LFLLLCFYAIGTWIALANRRENTLIKPTSFMETIETLKAEIKKLSSQAVQSKLDLHDLSEELPTNWERIPEVAQKTFQIYEKLIAAKQRLATMGG
jgi:hypothetical protein